MIRALLIDTEEFCSTLLEQLSLVQPVKRLQFPLEERTTEVRNGVSGGSSTHAASLERSLLYAGWESADSLTRGQPPDYDARTDPSRDARERFWGRFLEPADLKDEEFSTLVLNWLHLLQATLHRVLQCSIQAVAEAKGALEVFVLEQEGVVYQGSAEILQSKRLSARQTDSACLSDERSGRGVPPWSYTGTIAEVLIRYCHDDTASNGSMGAFTVGNIGLLSFEEREEVDRLKSSVRSFSEESHQPVFSPSHFERSAAFAYVAKLSTVNTYEGSRVTARLRLFLPDAEMHHKKNGRHADLLTRIFQARVTGLPARFTFVKTGNLASAVRLQCACKQLISREGARSPAARAYYSESFSLCEALPKVGMVPTAFTPLLGFFSGAGRKIRGLSPSVLRCLTDSLSFCDEQHAVILGCCGLDSRSYTESIPRLILIDGEAGTGKSHTIAGLIAAAHLAQKRILVVTPTVSALEHLLVLTHVVLFENWHPEAEAKRVGSTYEEEKSDGLRRIVSNAIGAYTTRGSPSTTAYKSVALDTEEGTVIDLYDITVREKKNS